MTSSFACVTKYYDLCLDKNVVGFPPKIVKHFQNHLPYKFLKKQRYSKTDDYSFLFPLHLKNITNQFVLLFFAFVQVYNLLPVKDLTGFPESLNQQEEDDGNCVNRHVYIDGIVYSPVSNTNEKDMYSFLKVNSLYCKWLSLKVQRYYILKDYLF